MAITPGFLALAVATAASPGPNNLMAIAAGSQLERRAGAAMLSGVCLGLAVVTVAVGAGLSGVLAQGGAVRLGLQLAGAGYLGWIGLRLLLRALTESALAPASLLSWRQAALFQLVNPRAWLSPASMAAAFSGEGTVWPTLGAYTLINFACIGAWMIAGMLLRHSVRDAASARLLNLALAVLTLLSIGLMFR